MKTTSDDPHTEEHADSLATILKVARAVAVFPLVMAIVLFLAAGRLDWTWGWVYLGISLANAVIAGPITVRTNPAPIAGQGELERTEEWDAGSLLSLLRMYIALPLVAGLDLRFGWPPDLNIAWHLAGGTLLAVGLGLASWVLATNPWVWSEVPVRPDQTVYSGGPYRFVRHPAYTGLVLQALGTPVLFGSAWALFPGLVAAVCIIVATYSEDRSLQTELPGYRDYASKVCFRLVPGVW